ncbi:MAG: DUF1731 domain-containing protein [Bacteroidetes bacterium]|nr:DUF1731 domain-containing protein [Bacteroidota bacterium]
MKSRWVIPQKLIAIRFHFKYPKIEDVMKDI